MSVPTRRFGDRQSVSALRLKARRNQSDHRGRDGQTDKGPSAGPVEGEPRRGGRLTFPWASPVFGTHLSDAKSARRPRPDTYCKKRERERHSWLVVGFQLFCPSALCPGGLSLLSLPRQVPTRRPFERSELRETQIILLAHKKRTFPIRQYLTSPWGPGPLLGGQR